MQHCCCFYSFYSSFLPLILTQTVPVLVGYIPWPSPKIVGSMTMSFDMFCSCLFIQTERDVSVRQRAVDLLYAMCDRSNAKQIVAEMLSYLETADYSIREEIVGHQYRTVHHLVPLCAALALSLLLVFLRCSRWPSWQKNMLWTTPGTWIPSSTSSASPVTMSVRRCGIVSSRSS